MPASDDDREMMARFNDTFRKLKMYSSQQGKSFIK